MCRGSNPRGGTMGKPITVAQLRDALDAYPDNLPIIMASDEEGNLFQYLYEISTDMVDVQYDRKEIKGLVLWP